MSFKYKPNFVAAWTDAKSSALLAEHRITRSVCLTTFFDTYGQMSSVKPYAWSAPKDARIVSVAEWTVSGNRQLIAMLEDCEWAEVVHNHYLAQGVVVDEPFWAHLVLRDYIEIGAAGAYQGLVGSIITFDRHGGQIDDRPPRTVEGDVTLRDWKVERFDAKRIRVTTPPMGGGVRENHMADRNSLDGDGFYMLANAMLQATRSRGDVDADVLVEEVSMAILGKEKDLAPGINWVCNRAWTVNTVRDLVRRALEQTGITRAATPEEHNTTTMAAHLLGSGR